MIPRRGFANYRAGFFGGVSNLCVIGFPLIAIARRWRVPCEWDAHHDPALQGP